MRHQEREPTPVQDDRGRLLRTPQAIAELKALLAAELGSRIDAIEPAPQEWSAGGGLHFSGTWRDTGTPVLIKLGVNLNQRYWTERIHEADPDLVPALFATGDRLGGLELGWSVMERVPFGPLGPGWNGDEFPMLLEAGVRFQKAARAIRPGHLRRVDPDLLREWLENGLQSDPPCPASLLLDRLEEDFAWVSSVCTFETCHGDLHMCNAVSRTPPPARGTALLIDCQPIVQPWAFDAGYPQILNSIDRSRVGYRDLIPKMARLRLELGLEVCPERDLLRLSRTVLAWFAIRQWALSPDRHSIPDYREETRRYIEEGSSVE